MLKERLSETVFASFSIYELKFCTCKVDAGRNDGDTGILGLYYTFLKIGFSGQQLINGSDHTSFVNTKSAGGVSLRICIYEQY